MSGYDKWSEGQRRINYTSMPSGGDHVVVTLVVRWDPNNSIDLLQRILGSLQDVDPSLSEDLDYAFGPREEDRDVR